MEQVFLQLIYWKLIIQIPCYNEANILPETLQSLPRKVEGFESVEWLIIDDGSTDNSKNIILDFIADNDNVKLIDSFNNKGKSEALNKGFQYCKGKIIITMDADLQDPPELIPQMITLYENGAQVVNTVRTLRRGESKTKMLVTKLAYRMINRISDIRLLENAGDFKLLGRRVVDEIIKLNEYQPYTRGLVPWVGFLGEKQFNRFRL
mgnify:CR=1 FL=1